MGSTSEIRNVLTYWGKGNGPPGFRIRFLDGGWIWLSPRTLNAEELVARLHRDLKASKDLARD